MGRRASPKHCLALQPHRSSNLTQSVLGRRLRDPRRPHQYSATAAIMPTLPPFHAAVNVYENLNATAVVDTTDSIGGTVTTGSESPHRAADMRPAASAGRTRPGAGILCRRGGLAAAAPAAPQAARARHGPVLSGGGRGGRGGRRAVIRHCAVIRRSTCIGLDSGSPSRDRGARQGRSRVQQGSARAPARRTGGGPHSRGAPCTGAGAQAPGPLVWPAPLCRAQCPCARARARMRALT